MHHKLPNDLRLRAYPRAHSTLQKWIFGNSSENSTKNRYQNFLILSSFAWFFFFFFTFFYYDQDCSHFFVKHYEIFWNKQIYWQMKCTEVKFSDGVFCLQAKKYMHTVYCCCKDHGTLFSDWLILGYELHPSTCYRCNRCAFVLPVDY